MHIDFVSVLPEMFAPVLAQGVVGRAATQQGFSWRAVPLRAFATGRHRAVDDSPYGGGAGMLLRPEPLVKAIRWCTGHGPDIPAPPLDAVDTPAPPDRVRAPGVHVVLMDAGGTRFTQGLARRFASQVHHLVLLCGRYEGVDERIKPHVDELVSVGDAILTGGELPAMMVADAVVRLLPGTLGNPESAFIESLEEGLLEYPQYTKPRTFEGVDVPDVLLSGNHDAMARWRRQRMLLRTRAERPEDLARIPLSKLDQRLLNDADGKPPPPRRKR
jgi:tRNA (guanine37-N1)-methyltransferase